MRNVRAQVPASASVNNGLRLLSGHKKDLDEGAREPGRQGRDGFPLRRFGLIRLPAGQQNMARAVERFVASQGILAVLQPSLRTVLFSLDM